MQNVEHVLNLIFHPSHESRLTTISHDDLSFKSYVLLHSRSSGTMARFLRKMHAPEFKGEGGGK